MEDIGGNAAAKTAVFRVGFRDGVLIPLPVEIYDLAVFHKGTFLLSAALQAASSEFFQNRSEGSPLPDNSGTLAAGQKSTIQTLAERRGQR